MIKYIASDLDGTILQNGAQQIPTEYFDLIHMLKENNIRFIAASGRQYHSIRHLFEPVKDDISYICENGSLCIHNGYVISRGLIDRCLGLRIIDAGREYNEKHRECHTLISCESRHYTDSKNKDFTDHMRYVLNNDIEVVKDLYDIEEPFLKLAICDFEGTEKLAPFLEERFSSDIRTATAGFEWVDFIAPNANKGIALSSLLNHLHIQPEEGITFGDQYNDIEMLKLAGTSYAMKTAAPGVEKYANHVTDSVINTVRAKLGTR